MNYTKCSTHGTRPTVDGMCALCALEHDTPHGADIERGPLLIDGIPFDELVKKPKELATENNHITYDTSTHRFIVWDEAQYDEVGRTDSYEGALRLLYQYGDYLTTGVKRGACVVDASPESWARIIEALNKHHPQWIDGNGSAVDKIVKFIEGVK